jgi:hypothetical protein
VPQAALCALSFSSLPARASCAAQQISSKPSVWPSTAVRRLSSLAFLPFAAP